MHCKLSVWALVAASTVGQALAYGYQSYSDLPLSRRDIAAILNARDFELDDMFEGILAERDDFDLWARMDVPSFNFQSATPQTAKPKTPPQVFSGPRMGNEQYFAGPKKPAYIPSDNPGAPKKPAGYPTSAPAMRSKLPGNQHLPKLKTNVRRSLAWDY